MAGKAGEGLSTLDEYISQCKQSGIFQMLSSQYICRAELCLRLGRPRDTEADLETAIEVAQRQDAKGWELRARLQLARIRAEEEKFEVARECLIEVVKWFTEGFETEDLIEAKALLEKLSHQPAV